ncbi:MAG: response regulator [Lachnospiraceae bacterium]|nr:response regulator [Lachnospiraceae bacterium]
MKLTMVIADDEPIVLKSEEIFLKKEFPDIEIIGIAENGVQLKQMLERLKPDMAMVDIHMPGLSGIEVIELLRHKNCATHFIINTAYSDFDYVKKALDLKTDGYLLKPSKREEKLEVINRLCDTIEQEKQKNLRKSGLESALSVVNSVLGSEILMSVFAENRDVEGFEAYCKINNITFTGGCIATFLLKTKKDISKRRLNGELETCLRGLCEFLVTVTSRGVVVMFFVPGEIERERRRDWCVELAQLVASHMEAQLGTPCLFGIGRVYDSFPEMGNSYQDSVKELQAGRKQESMLPVPENADKIQAYVD